MSQFSVVRADHWSDCEALQTRQWIVDGKAATSQLLRIIQKVIYRSRGLVKIFTLFLLGENVPIKRNLPLNSEFTV